MKTHFLGLRTVAYYVADLEKARDWYAVAFGIQPYFDEPFYVGFNIGGYELGLQPDENTGAVKTANVVVYWGVEDIQAAYDQMIRDGASPMEAPSDVGGEIKVATVADPWGNAIGLIYNPHFSLEKLPG